MRDLHLMVVAALLALSGCVVGNGPCLWLDPVHHTFTGHVHFRDYPSADGMDNIPLLVLDKTEYVYAPAASHQCLAANDVQLVGVAEFPQNIGEKSHVSVEGTLSQGVSAHEHTRFLINVSSIVPLSEKP